MVQVVYTREKTELGLFWEYLHCGQVSQEISHLFCRTTDGLFTIMNTVCSFEWTGSMENHGEYRADGSRSVVNLANKTPEEYALQQ